MLVKITENGYEPWGLINCGESVNQMRNY